MKKNKEAHKTENMINTDEQNATETTPKESVLSPEEELKQELAQLNDKHIRLFAEFDNFKKRSHRERIELFKTAGQEVLTALLPVIDDFDRALKAMNTTQNIDAIKEGVLLVQNKFKNILAQQGLKEMESIGKAFDPDLQEAITSIPAPTEDMKGKVLDEVEKGYYLNEKVIRHAKVIVGN